eukprot:TRINITY_DN66467_c8_g2_i1.p1 TRINITY_DN66467_c8_g2~~TRINITY_DN66467_c8_g2_i1.p1  ORF type:complete len:447 (-),score=213.09 TRINITY_DN66467_c8_g2_i1:1053-2393(-)
MILSRPLRLLAATRPRSRDLHRTLTPTLSVAASRMLSTWSVRDVAEVREGEEQAAAGRLQASAASLQRAAEIVRPVGGMEAMAGAVLLRLANVLRQAGRFEEEAAVRRRCVDLLDSDDGAADHGVHRRALVRSMALAGQWDDALQHSRERDDGLEAECRAWRAVINNDNNGNNQDVNAVADALDQSSRQQQLLRAMVLSTHDGDAACRIWSELIGGDDATSVLAALQMATVVDQDKQHSVQERHEWIAGALNKATELHEQAESHDSVLSAMLMVRALRTMARHLYDVEGEIVASEGVFRTAMSTCRRLLRAQDDNDGAALHRKVVQATIDGADDAFAWPVSVFAYSEASTAVLEYARLVAKLEWNDQLRLPEARTILESQLRLPRGRRKDLSPRFFASPLTNDWAALDRAIDSDELLLSSSTPSSLFLGDVDWIVRMNPVGWPAIK